MRITFDRLGLGCSSCMNKPNFCSKCERNVGLTQIRDYYKKIEAPKGSPRTPAAGDDTARISDENRHVLEEFGIRIPRPGNASPPGEQKPEG